MPAINFKQQFADDVEDGIKCQTIRKPRKDGRPNAKSGDVVKLYTGMRTKECRLLRQAIVRETKHVRIEHTHMYLDGVIVSNDNEFAQGDGFLSFTEMAEWFLDTYGSLPFEGTVIYWD